MNILDVDSNQAFIGLEIELFGVRKNDFKTEDDIIYDPGTCLK